MNDGDVDDDDDLGGADEVRFSMFLKSEKENAGAFDAVMKDKTSV
jgi:hypothetical protein